MMRREFITWLFKYDKTNGELYWQNHWLKSVEKRFKGKRVGTFVKGYRRTRIFYKFYNVHTLIWFIEKNEWPKFIDHIDGNKDNNKIENLRSVTHRKNHQNRKQHRNGKLVGASYNKNTNQWFSYIKINGTQKHLGCFATEKEAHERYLKELKYGELS